MIKAKKCDKSGKVEMVGSDGRGGRVSRRLEQAGNSLRQRQGRVRITLRF